MIYDLTAAKLIYSRTKIQMLGVTILLSLTVFMNMVSEIIPNTSDAVSIIGIETIPEDFNIARIRILFKFVLLLLLLCPSKQKHTYVYLHIQIYISIMPSFEDNFLIFLLFISVHVATFFQICRQIVSEPTSIFAGVTILLSLTVFHNIVTEAGFTVVLTYNSMDFRLMTPE